MDGSRSTTSRSASYPTRVASAPITPPSSGRYAEVLARQPDGSWLIDRFLGFEDSTVTRK
jgi:hypothetical protein